jgi:hypothetical protein
MSRWSPRHALVTLNNRSSDRVAENSFRQERAFDAQEPCNTVQVTHQLRRHFNPPHVTQVIAPSLAMFAKPRCFRHINPMDELEQLAQAIQTPPLNYNRRPPPLPTTIRPWPLIKTGFWLGIGIVAAWITSLIAYAILLAILGVIGITALRFHL